MCHKDSRGNKNKPKIHSYFTDEIFRIGTELQWIILS